MGWEFRAMQAAGFIRRGTLGFALAMLAALGGSGCSMFRQDARLETDFAELMPPKAPDGNPQVALQQFGQEEITGQPYPDPGVPPVGPGGPVGPDGQAPGELRMISLPRYRVAPPDVLLIYVLGMVPKNPYYLRPQDLLQIMVVGTAPDQPIAGTYSIEPNGTVSLGPLYGNVLIAGMTTDEAKDEIRLFLGRELQAPQVSVSVVQMAGQQEIAGEHIVGPDGTVNLGAFGSAYITGMTIEEATAAIEQHLSQYLESPRISLDVFAYNSMVYYVITSGAGLGDTITELPITGNDTVLSALARVDVSNRGLNQLTSTNMWVARPTPWGANCDQILPIDYESMTMAGASSTNYQLFPGDRLYVSANKFVALEQRLSKIIGPVERVLGVVLFGSQTVQSLQRFPGIQNSFN